MSKKYICVLKNNGAIDLPKDIINDLHKMSPNLAEEDIEVIFKTVPDKPGIIEILPGHRYPHVQ